MAPLLIQTTGLEDYAPGGAARVKVLNIGGPGAGKTRWASYFPKPIYADCEKGLASVADRKVPYVSIRSSQDMLDLLNHLKQECRQAPDQRAYETLVIDTLDAYQRKLKNEWMEATRKEAFSGWEAWGFLNAKMQLLMTRLLNLDMNVIVNVHYKDKTTKDDETGKESHELMLQLQGEMADTAFNDFDLVGWMGTYWEAVEGQRVQKRGLTFKPSPDKPFLKDRLHVTPNWLEVTFGKSDYEGLFSRIQARVDELEASQVVGEVPAGTPDGPAPMVIAPGGAGTGPLSPVQPKDIPLSQMDKPTLAKKVRDLGISTLPDGTPIRGNTLKSELIAALEHHAAPTDQKEQKEQRVQDSPAVPAERTAAEAAASTPPAQQVASEPAAQPTMPDAPQPESLADLKPEPVDAATAALRRYAKPAGPQPQGNTANPDRTQLKQEPEGLVNTQTGELVEKEQAVKAVEEILGGQVISETATPAAKPAEKPAAAPDAGVCEDCGKSLDGEKPDFVKLSWIKYRKRLCEESYTARKAGR